MLVEQLLGSDPYWRSVSVWQFQQRRQQVSREELRGFSWQQGRQVVDGTYRQLRTSSGVDKNSGIAENSGNGIHWDRVVWVGGVGRHINNDSQLSVAGVQGVLVDERWNRLRQVDTVDKDIAVDNLLEWPTRSSFLHVPLGQVFFWNTDLSEEVNGTRTTSAQGTNDQGSGVLSTVLFDGHSQVLLDISNQCVFVGVWSDAGQVLGVGVGLLKCPVGNTNGGAGKPGVETKGSNSSSLVVFQEFQVVQRTVALWEPAQDVLPATLVLVAVGELYVFVDQRKRFVFGQFLQANDDSVVRSSFPRALRHNGGADVGVFFGLEDRLGAFFDVDLEAGVKQFLSGGGGQGGTGFGGLGFGP